MFKGSTALQTSVVGAEIIPAAPQGWTMGYHFKHFEFLNDQLCTVKINGSNEAIYLRAGQGFRTPENFRDTIHSFKVVEAGITFNYLGQY